MIGTLRNGAFGLSLLAFSIGTALAAPSTPRAASNPLQVTMVPVTTLTSAEFLGAVNFSMTNTSAQPVRVLKWQTPFYGVQNNLFDVHVGADKVDYVGVYAKRGEPTADDYMTLAPYETKRVVLDLSENYEMDRTGQYQIQYHAYMQGLQVGNGFAEKAGRVSELTSFPMVVFVDGSDQFQEKAHKQPLDPLDGVGVKAGSIAYERCTTTQQSQLVTAVNSARSYASNAAAYYTHAAGQRFSWWFGTANYTTGKNHFNAISGALSNQTVTINCGCKKTYYAYVYPNDPYRIYVCKAFWAAPNTGRDSRAGTLIHETSHFTAVAGTDDHVYGASGAHSLALSNPTNAMDNADNHEYFGENTENYQ